ncbi:MAG TPA: DNA primase [Ottowia sp.]|uniref:DNA primase n=1 Tax=Ottowia sp. TaxID=1898956 RepID=UPI002C369CC8|nr:DNA primase [Ottowia sp.]HMN22429.1 DNA primase [Ottowia sp.]
MAIPQHFIQELLARADVVEVVGRHVQLKKTGANFSGLCPFHGEKTPSFTVSPSKQFYHCFGCGRHGNAIGFLMEHTGAGFVEAVHDLAQQYGLAVPEDERDPADRARAAQERAKRLTLTEVLARAAEAYREQLKRAPHAIDYLKRRGLSGEIARAYGLGWAPEGGHGLASVFPDYTDPLLQEAGLVIVAEDNPNRRYDRFRERIMFPIRDVKGEVIGFGGRVLGDQKPKYLNSPETPVFHKGRELYGLHEARHALREHGHALVVEGYMDVVALAQLGFGNAVATLGTACTPEHVHKLFRFTSDIVFSFDGDAAGRGAARKALEAALPLASDTRSVRFLFLPPEHDPDSFIRAEGPQAFGAALRQATPLSRFLLEAAAADCDLDSAEGRARFASQAQPLWKALPPGALARQLLGEIAQQVQIGVHELEALWSLRPARRPGAAGQAPHRPTSPAAPPAWARPPQSQPRAARPRAAPASRAERALQIVLTASDTWLALGAGDQQLLCDLPAPHGPLFVWLDRQAQEHGAQPWSALREALRGHEWEQVAVQAIENLHDDIASDPDELAAILRRERPQLLKKRMDAALAAGDLALYQALLAQLAAAKTAPTADPTGP